MKIEKNIRLLLSAVVITVLLCSCGSAASEPAGSMEISEIGRTGETAGTEEKSEAGGTETDEEDLKDRKEDPKGVEEGAAEEAGTETEIKADDGTGSGDSGVEDSGEKKPETLLKTSQEEIYKLDGIVLQVPESVENTEWTRITAEKVIDQVSFDWQGRSYTFRIAATEELEDISGMDCEWIYDNNYPGDGEICGIKYTEEGRGVCCWYENGCSQCVIMEKGADDGELLLIYEKMYAMACGRSS